MRIKAVQMMLYVIVTVSMLASGSATSVKVVSLPEMVGAANRIFLGVCLSAEESLQPQTGFYVREYRFRVLEGIKGVSQGQEVTLRQILSMTKGAPPLPGIPQYVKGEKLLLFLHGDSRLGLTSPVGLDQGTFFPKQLESGEIGYLNPFNNKNLAFGGEVRALNQSGLSVAEMDTLNSSRPIPLGDFRRMIERIERQQKGLREEQ